MVYRGCCIPNEHAADYVRGAQVVWPAFTSTTTDRQVAVMFAGSTSATHTSFLFEISTPLFCPLEDVSVFPSEREILLPAFSTFVVASVDNDGTHRRVYLQHVINPVVEDSPASAIDETSNPLNNVGPMVLRRVSKLDGAAGIAEDLTQLVTDADEHATCKLHITDGRVSGKLFFSSTAAADKVCKVLNGSLIDDLELSAKPSPIETDSLRICCCVLVRLSRIQHNGCTHIHCGSAGVARDFLAAASPAPGKSGEKGWRHVDLGGGATLRCKVDGKNDAMVYVAGVPSDFTAPRLRMLLRNKFPNLPHRAVRDLFKDKSLEKLEVKALESLGVSGTSNRIQWLTSVAGPRVSFVEEVTLRNGALYHLWYPDAASAQAAASAIDGLVMPETQLKASADLECFAQLVFGSDVHRVVDCELERQIEQLHEEQGGALTVQKRAVGTKGSHSVTIYSDEVGYMADAYRQLAALQRGITIKIGADDRPKMFPSRREQKRRDKVDRLVNTLSRQKRCVVRPQFATAEVTVIGATAACTEVAKEIAGFLRSEPYTHDIRCGFKNAKRIVAAITKQVPDVKAEQEKSVVKLQTVKHAALREAKELAASILRSGDGANRCSVCFDSTEDRLETCGHYLCQECAGTYVAMRTAENEIPITDPHTDCARVLLHEDLAKLTDDVAEVYAAGVRRFMITNMDRHAWCRTAGCPQMFDRAAAEVTCSICMAKQCPKCSDDVHENENCEEHRQRKMFESSREGKIAFHRKHIVDHMLAPACPSCGVAFIDFSELIAPS